MLVLDLPINKLIITEKHSEFRIITSSTNMVKLIGSPIEFSWGLSGGPKITYPTRKCAI